MKHGLKAGQIVEVSITGIQPYGAFALLPDGTSGLIHISEISDRFVRSIENFVQIGQTVKVKILDIDQNSQQSRLSLKAIDHTLKRREKRSIYRHSRRSIRETPQGFTPLSQMLPHWIADTKIKLGGTNSD